MPLGVIFWTDLNGRPFGLTGPLGALINMNTERTEPRGNEKFGAAAGGSTGDIASMGGAQLGDTLARGKVKLSDESY